ncbi:hypothetical protein KCP75_03885 [Salmonella enterica subsp. enterica]|nr:hypothetical protein KCP75_03885 [Salmonella enterica subsp. enterica]
MIEATAEAQDGENNEMLVHSAGASPRQFGRDYVYCMVTTVNVNSA